MARPSFTVPDGLLDDFDRALASKSARGELPPKVNRSKVIRELMYEYAREELGEGNSSTTPTAIAD
jgi:metal-responsive CopG/Arc/MetJ family transcriptional regulator